MALSVCETPTGSKSAIADSNQAVCFELYSGIMGGLLYFPGSSFPRDAGATQIYYLSHCFVSFSVIFRRVGSRARQRSVAQAGEFHHRGYSWFLFLQTRALYLNTFLDATPTGERSAAAAGDAAARSAVWLSFGST